MTSNTSGIPIHLMAEGRSEDFQKNFAGSHFFNPPRYLKLLEIIPTAKTDPAVTDFSAALRGSVSGKDYRALQGYAGLYSQPSWHLRDHGNTQNNAGTGFECG